MENKMKTILVLSSLLLSLNVVAHSVDENSTWGEIQNAHSHVTVEAPSVSFEERSISYLNTCISGDIIKTANKVKVWRMVDIGDRTEFVLVGKKTLSTPVDYVSSWEDCRGRNDRCTTYSENLSYADTVSIKVRANARGDRSFGKVLFTKDFTVPACK
jgi:hypothetical protein